MASAHILPDVMAFKGPEDNKICDPEGVRDMIECDESKPQKSSYYEVNVSTLLLNNRNGVSLERVGASGD